MTRKNRAITAASIAILGFLPASAFEKPVFQAGFISGYGYGQDGSPWPSLANPLGNNGRGGFYTSNLRLKGSVALDSTLSAVAVGNILASDVQEVYLEKRVANYTFTAGKFRGAGLKSGSGTDEFERITVNAPLYTRIWNYYKRLNNYRDLGIQAEADYFGGDLKHRFFIHNANRQNVILDEPSEAGTPTQALGFDYALDWRISPYTVWGGHLGALADRSWDEFNGSHKGWEVGYWFKSNPIVDASLNHQLDFGRLHFFNEAMLMLNREIPNPVDTGATKTWGVSTQGRFDHTARYGSFWRYEFFDHTDGAYSKDAKQLFTVGGIFHPSPQRYPGLRVTGEYVRALEDGAKNAFSNDVLYCQLQLLL